MLLLWCSPSRGGTRDRKRCQPVVHLRLVVAREWMVDLHQRLELERPEMESTPHGTPPACSSSSSSSCSRWAVLVEFAPKDQVPMELTPSSSSRPESAPVKAR